MQGGRFWRRDFDPRAPQGARLCCEYRHSADGAISIHTPLAGARLQRRPQGRSGDHISIHAPLAGRDHDGERCVHRLRHFNPRAPCGARPENRQKGCYRAAISIHAPLAGRDEYDRAKFTPQYFRFQSTRPLRGATPKPPEHYSTLLFQSTRPLWGATAMCSGTRLGLRSISIHAPLAGRDWGAGGR